MDNAPCASNVFNWQNARSRVRVGNSYIDLFIQIPLKHPSYIEEFEVTVGVHQGSVLSHLLFILVLEALSRDFRVGVP